ncbi:MAG: bis(5'-nucleosyl)-tetraphosphatase (symmetrical) YqeK [Atopobiaceae bacterium]|nr:bis(5'-nucleosyl)-tetraphosphatase (symmetrical) YqeK [Atopobiaceae bacterium]
MTQSLQTGSQTAPMLNQALLERIETDIKEHLAPKEKRLAHSLSVASTAETLAQRYGIDTSLARAAGLLHDWDKLDSDEQLIERAYAQGIDLGVDLELVAPVLHGLLSQRELPERYPELPDEVFQAIGKHTVGAPEMSDLDMVLFVADAIEPLRPAVPDIERLRQLAEQGIDLAELCKQTMASSLAFVLARGRYLWTQSVENYNALVMNTTA